MQFNLDNVQRLATKAYISHAHLAFGLAGEEALISVLDAVRLIFERLPPETISGTLTVIRGISSVVTTPAISKYGTVSSVTHYSQVEPRVNDLASTEHIIFEVMHDRTLRLIGLDVDISLTEVALGAVVYRYENSSDRILAKDFDDTVDKISPLLKSNFAKPTLKSLEDALEYYGEFVRETKCLVLSRVWEMGVDGPRLVLVNRPEKIMRDSLVQALSLLLGSEANVRPEQNTDETKPVDVRIDWFGSKAEALIEIKWLGRSTAVSRTPGPNPTYTNYDRPRAQEGADQLADYLDRQLRHTSSSSLRGYLVVFDARRLNIKGANDNLCRSDAMHFANDVLVYKPDYAATRTDYSEPVRFFLNPRQSHFVGG